MSADGSIAAILTLVYTDPLDPDEDECCWTHLTFFDLATR